MRPIIKDLAIDAGIAAAVAAAPLIAAPEFAFTPAYWALIGGTVTRAVLSALISSGLRLLRSRKVPAE